MNNLSGFLEEGLRMGKIKLGFGLIKPDKEIISSLRKSKKWANIVLVGPKKIDGIDGFEKLITKEPEKKLAEMLVSGDVDAIIRGTIDDFKTFEEYQKLVGKEKTKGMIGLGLLEDFKGRQFFLLSPSNPEGWTIESKIAQAEGVAKFIKKELRMEPKIGLITGRRHESFQRKKA